MGVSDRMMPWALVVMLVLYITASWSTHSDTMTGVRVAMFISLSDRLSGSVLWQSPSRWPPGAMPYRGLVAALVADGLLTRRRASLVSTLGIEASTAPPKSRARCLVPPTRNVPFAAHPKPIRFFFPPRASGAPRRPS